MTNISKLPLGWQIKSIGSFSKVTAGATPLRAEQERYFTGGTIPWIKTTDLNNSELFDSEEKITEIAVKENSCSILPENTVLIAMYGGYKQIGRTGILRIPAATNQALSAVRVDTKEVLPYFLLHYLNANVSQWKRLAASSRKDPNITRQDVLDYEVTLPPLAQQEKIISIADTWDEAIALQARQLQQLRLRKDGLSESLISGAKRLTGFSDEWPTVKLSAILSESRELLVSSNQHERITVKLNVKGVEKRNSSREEDEQATVYYRRTAGQFIYGKQNLHKGSVGIVPPELDGFGSSQDIPAFDVARDFSSDWLLHFFSREHYYKSLERLSSGTGSKRIQPAMLLRQAYNIPKLTEQRAIADVLNTAEAEIHLHERKLEALREQKRGLLQQLLTGEILLS
jgi:type I restriction enzyme S subunit